MQGIYLNAETPLNASYGVLSDPYTNKMLVNLSKTFSIIKIPNNFLIQLYSNIDFTYKVKIYNNNPINISKYGLILIYM